MLSTLTVVVSIIRFVGFSGFSLQNYNPSNCFQQQGNGAQGDNDDHVSQLPFAVGVQDIETLEHVEDAEDEYGVSDTVVVNVPVESVLVVLLRP